MYSKGYQKTPPPGPQPEQHNQAEPEPITRAPEPIRRGPDPLTRALAEFRKEFQELCLREEYKPLIKKSACYARDINLEQLADNSRISEPEKELLTKFRTENQAINNRIAEAFRTYGDVKGQEVALVFDRNESQIEKNDLALSEGPITWGDYNNRRKEINQSFQREYQEAIQPK